MKWYLLFLLFVIMVAGARTMFEIAYHGMGREHDFAPEADTMNPIWLTPWFIAMMVFDVLLIRTKDLPYRILFVALLSAGVFTPVVYMFSTR